MVGLTYYSYGRYGFRHLAGHCLLQRHENIIKGAIWLKGAGFYVVACL